MNKLFKIGAGAVITVFIVGMFKTAFPVVFNQIIDWFLVGIGVK